MIPLIKTKLTRHLLAYSFTHPDENYYVRELANLISEDAGNLSRELKKLEEQGLYKSSYRGRLKFYSLNKTYPLFKELKEIIFKTEGIEGGLKGVILQYKEIVFACIYGSFAKNEDKEISDIDLLIVGNFAQDKFICQINDLEAKLNREINFTSYSKNEFNKERKKTGSFLNLVLKEKIIVLKDIQNVK